MQITTQQYADVRGITSAAVRKALIKGHATPGIIDVHKFGNQILICIDTKRLAEYLKISEKKLKENLAVTLA